MCSILLWFIFPDTDTDRSPGVSWISIEYLMCTQLLLMPNFAANRSEQSWRKELCQEKEMFRVGRRHDESETDRSAESEEVRARSLKVGFLIDKRLLRPTLAVLPSFSCLYISTMCLQTANDSSSGFGPQWDVWRICPAFNPRKGPIMLISFN